MVLLDYGLAPEVHYPDSLNQCFTVYQWLLAGGLGFIPDHLALCGESAGGNIAAALCTKCIMTNTHLPDGNVFIYPALTMHLSPSPSRFLHQSDPLLPRGVLELALNSYNPSHGDVAQYKHNIHDPLVSPGQADDQLLRKFPPTSLMVGDLDPLLDDSVDFHTRLTMLGVSTRLKVFPGLPHGYLTYGDLAKEAQVAIDEARDLIYDIFRSAKQSSSASSSPVASSKK